MQQLLTKTEDWLYDEGEDVEKKVYDKKMSELKKMGDPVQERYREYENRKNAFDDFDRAIMVYFLILIGYMELLEGEKNLELRIAFYNLKQ